MDSSVDSEVQQGAPAEQAAVSEVCCYHLECSASVGAGDLV